MKALLIVAVVILLVLQQAHADPLMNARRQRIGNYDFEIATSPVSPVARSHTTIMLRMAGVNGDDLVDVPLTLRLERDGVQLHKAGLLVVPFGHYAYNYTFDRPGRYALYADLQDTAYSGQTLTFTFFIDVAGPTDYLYTVVPGVGVAGVVAIVVLKKARRGAGRNLGAFDEPQQG